ncbi:unnamed protein product [Penicillium camemberti]|uniref:Str. FM013 n=1 Tax=Penicillium camemberti (strain FM 013) TaxID=1429867 RepID=A0A0G4PUQ1_PENC3|nr:unnamed protein product [Penicillium camemberti]
MSPIPWEYCRTETVATYTILMHIMEYIGLAEIGKGLTQWRVR